MVGNIARTFTTRLIVMALGMVVSVVAARALGPAGRGQFAAAAAFAALVAQFGNLGLHGANIYLVGADRSRLPALLGNTLLVGLVWGTLLGGTAYVLSLTPRIAIVESQLRPLTAVAVPLMLSYMLLQNLAMGVERFDLFNLGELANVGTSLVLMLVIILVARLTPVSLLAASLAGPTLAGTWLLMSLVRLSGVSSSRALFWRGLAYGWRPYALSVAAFAVTRVDLFVVMSRLGATQAGYYSVALTLVGIFGTFPAIVGQVLFPRLCAISDLGARWRQTERTVIWLVVVVVLGAAAVAAVAGPLVRLLFGAAFLNAVPALRGLLIGAVFMAVHVAVVQYLNGLGYPVSIVILWIAAALLNWRLNLSLVPRLGLLGGAWSSGITYAVVAMGVIALALWYGPGTERGQARFARERP
jgi:antigen flippase